MKYCRSRTDQTRVEYVDKMVLSASDWRVHVLIALLATLALWTTYHVFPVLLYALSLPLAALLGALLAVFRGKSERRSRDTYPPPPRLGIEAALSRVKTYPPPAVRPTLLTASVDTRIEEVIELTLRHHVMPRYAELGRDKDAFFKSVVPDVWTVLANFLQRLQDIDVMKLATQDFVEALRSHFEHFHRMHYRDDSTQLPNFPMLDQFPYLESTERELDFLRQACEVLLCVTLPKDVLECSPLRVILREYLACQIVQPTIEMLCDPDYINQKVLAYLVQKEERGGMTTHVATFEEFLKQLNKCDDITELQQMKEFIITEIIQAKAVKRMKMSRAKGIQGSSFPIPIPAGKARALMERNLDTYITQLGTAKNVCERQIRKYGGEEYGSAQGSTAEARAEAYMSHTLPGIPFETIMKNDMARHHLLQFLERCGFSHLLLFWEALDSLRACPPGNLHKGVQSLYDEYLAPSAPKAVYASPVFVEGVEMYLSDKGPSCSPALLNMQESIYTELQEQFYEGFTASEDFRNLLQQSAETIDGSQPQLATLSESLLAESPYPLLDESGYRRKLKSLKTQLEEKDDELAAMPDRTQSSSLTQRRKALSKDRSQLHEEVKKLEHYIDHTEEWFGTIGKWSIEIFSVDLSKEEHYNKDPLFVIVIHRPEFGRRQKRGSVDQASSPESLMGGEQSRALHRGTSDDRASTVSDESAGEGPQSQSRAGWVVGRKLSEFEELHSKVSQICSGLKFPSLPTRLNPLTKPDAQSKYWQKYKHSLQEYLERIMGHEKLQESEEVFNFLSPVSENLRKTSLVPPEKKRLFHLSMRGMGMFSKEPEDDATTDHVILLLREVFELEGWSKSWRKQFMELAQLTFGRSLDRELQEFMTWSVSEPMLIFYLELFRDSMWPGGNPAPHAPRRSDEEKLQTKEEAKKRFLKNVPPSLQTVLGQRNCQIGYSKIFEAFQDARANRQLFYSLLELFLIALVPELETVEIEDALSDWKGSVCV